MAISATRVAAAIVTFNRVSVLGKLIEAILSQTTPPGAVIVVDNASPDGTAQVVRDLYPSVVLVSMADNIGPAGGFGEALRAATSLGFDWAWTFDDDDLPDPDALETLLASLDGLPERTAMVGCARRNGVGGYWSLGATWHHRHLEIAYSGPDEPLMLDVITFSGALVSRRIVDRVGLPRADFFMMLEDLEYCLRIRRAGWGIVVIREPLVTAFAMGSNGSAAWRGYYQTRNHLLMARTNGSTLDVCWWGVRTMKFVLAALASGSEGRRRAHMRMRGAWDGMRGISGKTVLPTAAVERVTVE